MTIDELLQIAQDHVQVAVNDTDTACATRYAVTAQAAALTAQAMMMHSRAEAELAALHDYLDMVLLPGSGDQGRAVPALDRVLLLVSTLAGDRGEVARLREQVRVLRIAVQEAYNYLDEQVGDDVESELYITFAVVREAWYAVRDTPA